MAIEPVFDFVTEIFTNSTFFGLEGLIGLISTIFVMLIITRDLQKWRTLCLPVSVMIHIIGIQQNILLFVIGIIMFVQTNLGLEIVGKTLGNVTTAISSTITGRNSFGKDIKKAYSYSTDKDTRDYYKSRKENNKLIKEETLWNEHNERLDNIRKLKNKKTIGGLLDNVFSHNQDNTIHNEINQVYNVPKSTQENKILRNYELMNNIKLKYSKNDINRIANAFIKKDLKKGVNLEELQNKYKYIK